MGWFAFGSRQGVKGDAVSNGEEASSAPDIVVPDVDTSSQRILPPVAAQKPEWGKHLRSEINPCQSWFHVTDPVNGRVLDIPESFAPASGYAFIWKALYCSLCIFTIVWAMLHSVAYFYFAYFTNWGLLCCTLYSLMSVLNTVMASRTGQPAADKSVGFRIRLTWILLTTGLHNGAMASLLFWPLVFDPNKDLTYSSIAPHGVIVLLTLLDGFYVNRIPLRFMHYIGVALPIDICFALWSYVHSALDIGNPNKHDNDASTNDDAIYANVLEWNHDWQTAVMWIVIAMLILGPMMFTLLWTISTGGCCKDTRRYVDNVDPRDVRPTVYDVEETVYDGEKGSVFAKWR